MLTLRVQEQCPNCSRTILSYPAERSDGICFPPLPLLVQAEFFFTLPCRTVERICTVFAEFFQKESTFFYRNGRTDCTLLNGRTESTFYRMVENGVCALHRMVDFSYRMIELNPSYSVRYRCLSLLTTLSSIQLRATAPPVVPVVGLPQYSRRRLFQATHI